MRPGDIVGCQQRESSAHEVIHLVEQLLAVVLPESAAMDVEDGVLHGVDLRCFGHAIPWHLDQTFVAGGHQRRGRGN